LVLGQAAEGVDAHGFRQAQQGQAAHRGRVARAGEVGVEALVAQDRIHGLGDDAAFAAAKARVVLEEARQGDVGGRGKAQNLAQDLFGLGEDCGWQSHGNPC
jgi:hypothetical protein